MIFCRVNSKVQSKCPQIILKICNQSLSFFVGWSVCLSLFFEGQHELRTDPLSTCGGVSSSQTHWHTDWLRVVMCFAVDSLHAWAQLQAVSSTFRSAARAPMVLSHFKLRPARPSVLIRAVGVRHAHVDCGRSYIPNLFIETYPLNTFLRNLPVGLLSLTLEGAFIPGLAVLDRCSNLRTLYINDCFFTSLERFPHLPGLRCLVMQGVDQFARFRIHIPSLAPLQGLQSLVVEMSSVSDTHLEDISTMKELHTLVLRPCLVTDAGVKLLARLPSLEQLAVSSCGLTDVALGHVAEFPSICVLVVEGCPSLSPHSIAALLRSRPAMTVIS